MSTIAFLNSPVVKNGSVKMKKFDGTPQRQWERIAAHALLVFSVTCFVLGLYLLGTSNLGPAPEPTQPQERHEQPVQNQPAEQPALRA